MTDAVFCQDFLLDNSHGDVLQTLRAMASDREQSAVDLIFDFFRARTRDENVSHLCAGRLARLETWLFETRGSFPEVCEVFDLRSAESLGEDDEEATINLKASLSYLSNDADAVRLDRDSSLDGIVKLKRVNHRWRIVDFTRDGRSVLEASMEHEQTFSTDDGSLDVHASILGGRYTHVIGRLVNGMSMPIFAHQATLLRPFFFGSGRSLGATVHPVEIPPGKDRLIRVVFPKVLKLSSRSVRFLMPVLLRGTKSWSNMWVNVARDRR